MKIRTILLIISLLIVPIIYAETSYNCLTKGQADSLYCQFNGTCYLQFLTVTNMTVTTYNVTSIDYNITGVLEAETIKINGTSLYDIFVSNSYFLTYMSSYYTKAEVYTKTESNALYCPISGGCGGTSSGISTFLMLPACEGDPCLINVTETDNQINVSVYNP